MAAEYSFVPLQNVAENANVVFADGDRACRKAACQITELAKQLQTHADPNISDLARQILAATAGLEE